MLSICCLSGGRPERLTALLSVLRPVADELVVAVDDRVDLDRLAGARDLADVLVAYPYADPVERPFGWLHSLCSGEWIFRIDDDEIPSAALLESLQAPDERLTHAWVPRRWLWADGWLGGDPWAPDWQLRLVRAGAASFPGQMHVPVRASGPHAYLAQSALYHLDLVANDRESREQKVARYERIRPGLRLGELSLNAAYYLPELRTELAVEPIPEADAALIDRIQNPPLAPAAVRESVVLRDATRGEIDEHWAEAPFLESDYAVRIELGRPPSPVTGEVREIDVRVTNLGSVTWPGGRDALPEIRLSSRWEGLDPSDEQLRSAFPHDVAPGETVLVPMSFRAPAAPGPHVLVVDLVHERHRWFGADATTEVVVRPERRAVVLVGQPPGEETFDQRVDDLLGSINPALNPVLVGPKPDWLHDRFGAAAYADQPPRADSVFVVSSGPRRRRLLLQIQAGELRFESWRDAHKTFSRARTGGGSSQSPRASALKQLLLSALVVGALAGGASAGGLIDLGSTASAGQGGLPKARKTVVHGIELVGAEHFAPAAFVTMRR